MTNFSLVSVPFCLMVAETLGLSGDFPVFYLCVCIVGIILAVIIARIPPIRTIPNTYREATGKQVAEDLPRRKGFFPTPWNPAVKEPVNFMWTQFW